MKPTFPVMEGNLGEIGTLHNFLIAYDSLHLKRPEIDFNPIITPYKLYVANTLLTLLPSLRAEDVIYLDDCGHKIDRLKAKFNNGQFFTRINGSVIWKMVGFSGALPALLFRKNDLHFALYFDSRIFINAKTGYKDYLPSASFIITNISIGYPHFSRVPFSWGSDIVMIDFYTKSTLFIGVILGNMPKRDRTHFSGFKYVDSKFKYAITPKKITKKEAIFLTNSGFLTGQSIISTMQFKNFISRELNIYFSKQNLMIQKLRRE